MVAAVERTDPRGQVVLPQSLVGKSTSCGYLTTRARSSGRKAVKRRPLAASITPERTNPTATSREATTYAAREVQVTGRQNTSCGTIARPAS